MWDGPGKSKEDWTRQPIFKLYLHSFNFLNLHATSGKRRGSVDAWNCSKLNRVFSELFCLALLALGAYAMLVPMSAFSGEAGNLGQNLQDAEPRNVICQEWYLCANTSEISTHSPYPELQISVSSCFHAWFCGLPCASLNLPGSLPPGHWAPPSLQLYPQHLGFIRMCNVSSISSRKSSLTLFHPLPGYVLIFCPFPDPLQVF